MLENASAEVVGEATIPFCADDHGAVLAAIRGARPDVVLMLLAGAEAARFNRAFAEDGLSAGILRFGLGVDQTVLYAGGADASEQLRILEALHAADGRPMNELAALALIEPTTLTKVIDRMVAEQLVFRTQDLEDRRRILIMLAPAARILFRRLNCITASQQERIAKQMPPGRLEELHSLLRSLVEQPLG